MRCSDGNHYVVKFQNNPQGVRVLANEMLGVKLASRLRLPVTKGEVVSVSEDLIAKATDLKIQVGRGHVLCKAGLQFGSRYPGQYKEVPVFDFLPNEQLVAVSNLIDFLGMLVFDKWTCNTDGRQAIFIQAGDSSQYFAYMIDNGFCFNAGEWNFPDAPLRGLYARRCVYEMVHGIKSFEIWINALERITESTLEDILTEIPTEWYEHDSDAMGRMLDRLLLRRHRVPELIESAWKSSAQPFPNWR
jgi:HipA-like kinase